MIDKNFLVGLFWAESSPGKEDYVCLELIPSEPFQSGLQFQGTQVVKALLSAEPNVLQRPLCCWPRTEIGVAIIFLYWLIRSGCSNCSVDPGSIGQLLGDLKLSSRLCSLIPAWNKYKKQGLIGRVKTAALPVVLDL